jgi:hypothetical protein
LYALVRRVWRGPSDGHSKIETAKNSYGHLFAQDQAAILDALNQAVSRLYVYESQSPQALGGAGAVA